MSSWQWWSTSFLVYPEVYAIYSNSNVIEFVIYYSAIPLSMHIKIEGEELVVLEESYSDDQNYTSHTPKVRCYGGTTS